MSRIVVFGAGGRAGRYVVTEALARGHRVTAVLRDPARYGPAPEGVTLVAGDVTREDEVAAAAAGHDAAVNAAARLDVPAGEFFPAAAGALLAGLARAGVGRLVLVGIGTALETAPGVKVHDAPGFPAEYREFSVGHAAQLDVLRAADTPVDWVVLAPPPVVLDADAPRTGRYRIGDGTVLPGGDGSASFSYADLAVAIVDEIETPRRHRVLAAVAG
ncbi:3-beta hydroxysteroid dehydrogenase [Sphaerisporangium rufum]|uniref:3-beta hydroxysteroid dehydrogenase n=1 Tax=Sphaerisporangium rufum TaxID=1381558 RepID=A0A919V0B4_9ACTN|nr:NAD(P)H-binding protein [Sphaerisporangium rufum]GII79901.1 3-beta hydroxysteroid dehydrogenase [Sphaerisporangium rufum]